MSLQPQKVINHIHNGVDFVPEHAQTSSDMVIHNSGNLRDFLATMFPNTGGIITGNLGVTNDLNVNGNVDFAKNLNVYGNAAIRTNFDVYGSAGFKQNIFLAKELILNDYYDNNRANCSIWFGTTDRKVLFLDRVDEVQINTGGLKCKRYLKTESGFLQDLDNVGTHVVMDGRGGQSSNYGLGWYFSNGKGTFVDLYAKNVQNQCDERVKDILPSTKEIKTTPNAVENIIPKKYKYHGEEKIRYGFIAQEVEKYVPEAVTTLNYSEREENIPIDKYGNKILDCKTIDLMALVATLWEEVKRLKEEIKSLKAII